MFARYFRTEPVITVLNCDFNAGFLLK